MISYILGKYPHLLVECEDKSSYSTEGLLEFGTVSIGSSATKRMKIVNLSNVSILTYGFIGFLFYVFICLFC